MLSVIIHFHLMHTRTCILPLSLSPHKSLMKIFVIYPQQKTLKLPPPYKQIIYMTSLTSVQYDCIFTHQANT